MAVAMPSSVRADWVMVPRLVVKVTSVPSLMNPPALSLTVARMAREDDDSAVTDCESDERASDETMDV